MSNETQAGNQNNPIGGTIGDPPEVTDIVIVSNPPPKDDEITEGAASSETTLKTTGIISLHIAASYVSQPYSNLYVELSNLTPLGNEPAPDPNTPDRADYVSETNGQLLFTTSSAVSFASNLQSGGDYDMTWTLFQEVSGSDPVNLGSGRFTNAPVINSEA